MARVNLFVSVGNSSKQMQQTSGSSFCRCGDGEEAVDEGFVVELSFLSSSPSFLDCGGGDDEVVVVVDVSSLTLSLAFFVAVFSCTNRRCSS